MRLQYSPEVRIVKLLCTGKIEPVLILEAFRHGADAVFVAGCLEGECHFLEGNLRARQLVDYAKELLQDAGIDPRRLEMFNMSAAMAQTFAEAVETMVERVKELGPSPLSGTVADTEAGVDAQLTP
jgi:coenzyme F420-reducing hydrogenase delta subunit